MKPLLNNRSQFIHRPEGAEEHTCVIDSGVSFVAKSQLDQHDRSFGSLKEVQPSLLSQGDFAQSEDAVFFGPTSDTYAIFDGASQSGHDNAARASRFAARAVDFYEHLSFQDQSSEILQDIEQVQQLHGPLDYASSVITQSTKGKGYTTGTLVRISVKNGTIFWSGYNVGDSRAYLVLASRRTNQRVAYPLTVDEGIGAGLDNRLGGKTQWDGPHSGRTKQKISGYVRLKESGKKPGIKISLETEKHRFADRFYDQPEDEFENSILDDENALVWIVLATDGVTDFLEPSIYDPIRDEVEYIPSTEELIAQTVFATRDAQSAADALTHQLAKKYDDRTAVVLRVH